MLSNFFLMATSQSRTKTIAQKKYRTISSNRENYTWIHLNDSLPSLELLTLWGFLSLHFRCQKKRENHCWLIARTLNWCHEISLEMRNFFVNKKCDRFMNLDDGVVCTRYWVGSSMAMNFENDLPETYKEYLNTFAW